MTLMTAATGSYISATFPSSASSADWSVASFCIWLRCRHRDDRPGVRRAPELFREVAEQGSKHLCRTATTRALASILTKTRLNRHDSTAMSMRALSSFELFIR